MLAGTAEDLGAALARAAPAPSSGSSTARACRSTATATTSRSSPARSTTSRPRVPEVVEAALPLPAARAVLDGEAIALTPDGRPRPFQVTASRFLARARRPARGDPLTPFLFDVLHLDGEDLLDRPLQRARRALDARGRRAAHRGSARVDADAASAARRPLLDDALARGHEGVMVKALERPTPPGAAAATGSRSSRSTRSTSSSWPPSGATAAAAGWLRTCTSAPATRRAAAGAMLGKTFKGLTDAMLAWQTERLLALETPRDGHVVHVRPSSWSRSPSTACSARRATRPAWRCASRGCAATGGQARRRGRQRRAGPRAAAGD